MELYHHKKYSRHIQLMIYWEIQDQLHHTMWAPKTLCLLVFFNPMFNYGSNYPINPSETVVMFTNLAILGAHFVWKSLETTINAGKYWRWNLPIISNYIIVYGISTPTIICTSISKHPGIGLGGAARLYARWAAFHESARGRRKRTGAQVDPSSLYAIYIYIYML